MMSRAIFLLSCLLAAGITIVSAQSLADNETTAAPTEQKKRSLMETSADSERMQQVYGMMSTEELSVFAQRIYLVKRFQAKKMKQPVPEKLPEDMLSDRKRLIEYIIENGKE